MNSVTSFNVDELAQKNEERLRRLEAMKQARSGEERNINVLVRRLIQLLMNFSKKSSLFCCSLVYYSLYGLVFGLWSSL